MKIKISVSFLAFSFLIAGLYAQTSKAQVFTAKSGEKFDKIEMPGGSFKIVEYVSSARTSSGIVLFPDATVGKTSHCEVQVHVKEGVEIGRSVSVSGKKKAGKFYTKQLKEEFGVPTRLVEVHKIYIYQWSIIPLNDNASVKIEYRWDDNEGVGTFSTTLLLKEE